MIMVQGLKIGTILQNGTYRIVKVLGQGSFGITYLAKAKFRTQGNLGSMNVEAQVAIKEFFMSEVNSRRSDGSSVEGSSGSVFANYRKKFKKEAENLSKLSLSNIVKVVDVFDENNTTYYVMEFIEGKNLDDYIKQKGSLPEPEAISIIKEVGNALEYMHSRKMLHLDIKPKNIMRKPDGTIYLIDFGLSKQFTDNGEPESSTSIGLGTPGYAPIEQSSYKQDGTFPATLDVYALGATMFKMLTGKRPPEATIILNEGFPSVELSNKGISDNTISTIKAAMISTKKERYQTIKAFVENLNKDDIEDVTIIEQPAQNTESIHSTNPSPKPNSKSKWIWSAVLFLVLIVASILWKVYPIQKETSEGEIITDSIGNNLASINHVEKMKWESPLGEAVYTGDVEQDSVPGSTKLIPHGRGVAKIAKGKYSGNVYDGDFEWGKMHGKATYTLKNGDVFVGTFVNGEYAKGRYTVKSTGQYFEGSFKNGQPDKGIFYDKNGKNIDANSKREPQNDKSVEKQKRKRSNASSEDSRKRKIKEVEKRALKRKLEKSGKGCIEQGIKDFTPTFGLG